MAISNFKSKNGEKIFEKIEILKKNCFLKQLVHFSSGPGIGMV
jgi:hypothetical protein